MSVSRLTKYKSAERWGPAMSKGRFTKYTSAIGQLPCMVCCEITKPREEVLEIDVDGGMWNENLYVCSKCQTLTFKEIWLRQELDEAKK